MAGYEAGNTMKELTAEFAISRQTVSTHLRRAKTPIRREGLDGISLDDGLETGSASFDDGDGPVSVIGAGDVGETSGRRRRRR